jgi:hypothetical protein
MKNSALFLLANPLTWPHSSSKRFRLSSDPRESRADFMARLAQAARESRDLEVEKLRRKYSSKFNTLNNRMMSAEQRYDPGVLRPDLAALPPGCPGAAVSGLDLGNQLIACSSQLIVRFDFIHLTISYQPSGRVH